jgi:D-beta-D-heptose 7-phosphate kinase/D-beta-D-heptose 1-phosphate adenosyltransferase
MGDILIVAINDDASVKRLKGDSRPLYPASERAEILLALRWVDAVTIFSEDTPLVAIEKVQPDVLVKGAEYGAGEIVGEEFVNARGGRVVRYPMAKGHSTSEIVRRMGDK